MTPTEEFGQLRLKFTDPIQDGYEIIRPIVLFDETVSERSRQTGLERRRIGEKAKSFVHKGMLGLVDERTETSKGQVHEYPEAVAEYIFYLKQLYPPIITVKLCASLSENMGIRLITTPLKTFWSDIRSPFNSSLSSPTFTILSKPTRPVGP
jgi:hypothetical protein